MTINKLGKAVSDSVSPMAQACLADERHFVTFIDVTTVFAASIPAVSWDKIPGLTDSTFNNFRENYGHTPSIFVSDNAPEYLSDRFQRMLHCKCCTLLIAIKCQPLTTTRKRTELLKD